MVTGQQPLSAHLSQLLLLPLPEMEKEDGENGKRESGGLECLQYLSPTLSVPVSFQSRELEEQWLTHHGRGWQHYDLAHYLFLNVFALLLSEAGRGLLPLKVKMLQGMDVVLQGEGRMTSF